MAVEIDMGYDFIEDSHIILEFDDVQKANEFANEVMRKTGEVLEVTETKGGEVKC